MIHGLQKPTKSLALDEVSRLIQPIEGPNGDLTSADVIIVGAGPIGLTAANVLGSLGVSTLLIERNAVTADLPRAIAVDDEFMRLLHRLGIGPDLADHLSPPFGIYFYSAFGKPIVKVPPFVTSNGFGKRSGVAQPVLEKVLLKSAGRFDCVKVRYGAELTGLEQDSDGVQCRIRDAAGKDHVVCGRFILACDGARSFVRSLLKIPFLGTRIDEPHLVIDFAAFPDQSPYSRFYCNPRRPLNSIPAPYGGRRLEFMLMPDDDRAAIISEPSVNRLLDEFSPYPGVRAEIVRKTIYGFSERVAQRFQDGRVFLLGDAAHVMPPFGAQAMNTGARDVANLCWKLEQVLRGGADVDVLSTYEPERRPQVEAIVRYSVRIGRLANLHSWPAALARDATFSALCTLPAIRRYFNEMRYMPAPKISSGLVEGESALVGKLFPRVSLRSNGETLNLDQVLAPGFALVAVRLDETQAARCIAAPPRHWIATTLFIDSSLPAISRQSASIAHSVDPAELNPMRETVVLVRPDRYVAAVCQADETEGMLDRFEHKMRFGSKHETSVAA